MYIYIPCRSYDARFAWFLVNYALRLIRDNGDSQNHKQ